MKNKIVFAPEAMRCSTKKAVADAPLACGTNPIFLVSTFPTYRGSKPQATSEALVDLASFLVIPLEDITIISGTEQIA